MNKEFRAIDIASVLTKAPILSKSNPHELARIVHLVEVKSFAAGEMLFEVYQPARIFFLLCSGTVIIRSGKRDVEKVTSGFVGEEAAIKRSAYISDAVAEGSVQVLAIPGDIIQPILQNAPRMLAEFNSSLTNHYAKPYPPSTDSSAPDGSGKKGQETQEIAVSIMQPIGLLAAMVVPTLLYFYLSGMAIDSRSVNYLLVFSVTIIMWGFRLMPEFVPALFLMLASIILGVVPVRVVLSGFSSGSFFMALSVFGIGSVLTASGLTYRLALWLLKKAPRSQFGYECAMLLVGILLTPILPSANGRVTMVLPIVEDILQSVRYKRGGIAATRLAAATFTGITLLSAMFLTSKSINFAVYDLFPAQVKYQFTWGYWLVAAALAGMVLLAGHFFFSWLIFRNDEKPILNKKRVDAQISIIGPAGGNEWIALGAVVIFILGALTSSLHKIQPPWVGLAVLYLLMALGLFSKTNLRKNIDWGFLMMLAGMISIVKTMAYLGLDNYLKLHLQWMGVYMEENFYVFLLLLSLITFVIRFIMPNNASVILLCTAFLPIAEAQGVSAWIIAFIVLLISDAWFAGYQCTYYVVFREGTRKKRVDFYSERRMLLYIFCINLVRIAAVFASVPYWKALNLL